MFKKNIVRIRNAVSWMRLSFSKNKYGTTSLRDNYDFCRPWRDGWTWALLCKRLNRKQRTNLDVTFPVSHLNTVWNPWNIHFDPSSWKVFCGSGKCFQGFGHVYIGKNVHIANNVALITVNHDVYNLNKHTVPETIVLGDNCWIGINSVILPGAVLGNRTIFGAGSVVAHSYPEGNVIIAGNPAKPIHKLSVHFRS